MSLLRRFIVLLCGTDPGLRRMLQYWVATAVLYTACIVLLLVQVERGITAPAAAGRLIAFNGCGALAFCILVRAGARLGLAPDQLAVSQAIFSLVCGMWLYAISGPMRAAVLLMTVVILVFCMFAARPRQTMLLSIGALVCAGGLMWWLQDSDPAGFPPLTEAITFSYLASALIATAVLSGEMHKLRSRLKRQRHELSEALDTIRVLATVDDLTSLVNRRHMHEVLAAEERRQAGDPASGRPSCIALLDIDFFKQVNDQYGHAVGDAVLRGFSAEARAALRVNDVLARWGGEEFLLLLPDTAAEDARMVLERMAERVSVMTVPGLNGRRISFSAGLATRQLGEPFSDAIQRADKALYQAKEAGRDRIVLA